MNLLFICSKNQWRSPTAEAIFKDHGLHHARSAGTEPGARIRVTEKLLRWADLVFVIEKKHRTRLEEKFGLLADEKTVIILEIADEYQYMDPELVDMLRAAVEAYL